MDLYPALPPYSTKESSSFEILYSGQVHHYPAGNIHAGTKLFKIPAQEQDCLLFQFFCFFGKTIVYKSSLTDGRLQSMPIQTFTIKREGVLLLAIG